MGDSVLVVRVVSVALTRLPAPLPTSFFFSASFPLFSSFPLLSCHSLPDVVIAIPNGRHEGGIHGISRQRLGPKVMGGGEGLTGRTTTLQQPLHGAI